MLKLLINLNYLNSKNLDINKIKNKFWMDYRRKADLSQKLFSLSKKTTF